MKNLLLILLCLALNGCATFQISELEKKGPAYSLVENLSYSKKEIFDVLPEAVKNASDSSLIIRSSDFEKGEVYAQNSYLTTMGTSVIGYYGAKKIMFGVFLKGDNPTQVKIMQWSSGYGTKDYKNKVMQEIKSLMEFNRTQ